MYSPKGRGSACWIIWGSQFLLAGVSATLRLFFARNEVNKRYGDLVTIRGRGKRDDHTCHAEDDRTAVRRIFESQLLGRVRSSLLASCLSCVLAVTQTVLVPDLLSFGPCVQHYGEASGQQLVGGARRGVRTSHCTGCCGCVGRVTTRPRTPAVDVNRRL